MKIKINLLFALLFNYWALGQVEQDSINNLPELDFNKESIQNLENYQKHLNKTGITLTLNLHFKGKYYKNNGSEFSFDGNAKYNKNLSLKKVKFNQEIPDNEKVTLNKVFDKLYMLSYTYYRFAIDNINNKQILTDLYCIEKGNNKWQFFINKKHNKEDLKIKSSKAHFEVQLSSDGNIEQITSFLNSSKNLIPDNPNITANHFITINFAPFKSGIKLTSVKGEIIKLSNKDKIEIEIFTDKGIILSP